MAAYEVLLLNTAIPQIQAAQSGDTYVVPRDIAFSTVASFAAGAEATPSIVATGDTNTGIWFPAADTVAISTGGISRLRLDSSGNLGIGETNPAARLDVRNGVAGEFVAINALNTLYDAATAASSTIRLGITNSAGVSYATIKAAETSNDDYPSLVFGVQAAVTTNPTERARISSDGTFRVKGAGTAGTTDAVQFSGSAPASAMTLDASGNLGIGVTSYPGEGALAVRKGAIDSFSGTGYRTASFCSTTAANADQPGIVLGYDTAGAGIVAARTNGTGQPLAFWTFNGSSWGERARITSGGNLLVGETSSNSGNNGLKVKGQFALTTAQTFTASGSVNDSAYYIVCYSLSATCTLTLPTPANNTGRLLNIVVQSAQQVVSASSNVTAIADGTVGTAILPATAGKWAQLWCDGAYWNIIATNV